MVSKSCNHIWHLGMFVDDNNLIKEVYLCNQHPPEQRLSLALAFHIYISSPPRSPHGPYSVGHIAHTYVPQTRVLQRKNVGKNKRNCLINSACDTRMWNVEERRWNRCVKGQEIQKLGKKKTIYLFLFSSCTWGNGPIRDRVEGM